MAFRPAGFSDEEDDMDDFDDYPKKKNKNKTTDKPKLNNICDCLWAQDPSSLVNCIATAKEKCIKIDFDALHNDIPLLVACSVPWAEGVKILLENGANPNAKRELLSPLAQCCLGSSFNDKMLSQCAQLLLEYGSDPNQCDHIGRSPLIIAAISGLTLVTDCLLNNSQIEINKTDPAGWTALFHAKAKGHVAIFEKLTAAGADVTIRAINRLCLDDVEIVGMETEDKGRDISVDALFCEQPGAHLDCESMGDAGVECVEKFLSYLPDSAGRGGLSDCAARVLQEAGAGAALPLLTAAPSLPVLLAGDEAALERLGIAFTFDRHRILQTAHRLHLSKWDSSALKRIPSQQPMGLSEIGNVLCAYLQQLVTMNSAVQFLEMRMDNFHPNSGGLAENADLLEILTAMHENYAKIRRQLTAVLSKLNKIRPIQSSKADYKGPERIKNLHSMPFKMVAAIIAIFGATFLKFLPSSYQTL